MYFRMFMVLLIPFALFLGACSEDPDPVIPVEDDGGEKKEEGEGEALTLKAVTYAGKIFVTNKKSGKLEPTDKDCTLNFSMVEEEHEEHEEEEDGGHKKGEEEAHHHMIAQMTEKIHGEATAAMELEPYFYSFKENKYMEAKPASGDYEPTLVGIALSDEETEPDVNKIEEYAEPANPKDPILLLQSLEIVFDKGMDFEAMEREMEEVIEAKSTKLTAESMKALDQLGKSLIQIKHGSHVDPRHCGNFKLMEDTKMVEFNLEHEEHEHEEGEEKD